MGGNNCARDARTSTSLRTEISGSQDSTSLNCACRWIMALAISVGEAAKEGSGFGAYISFQVGRMGTSLPVRPVTARRTGPRVAQMVMGSPARSPRLSFGWSCSPEQLQPGHIHERRVRLISLIDIGRSRRAACSTSQGTRSKSRATSVTLNGSSTCSRGESEVATNHFNLSRSKIEASSRAPPLP